VIAGSHGFQEAGKEKNGLQQSDDEMKEIHPRLFLAVLL